MKKLFIIIISVFLTSCSYFEQSSNIEKITPPTIISPLNGTWTIEKIINSNTSSDSFMKSDIINKNIKINENYFVLGDYYWKNISIKTRVVKTSDYIKSVNESISKSINIEKLGDEIEIFSIMDNSKLLCDIISADDIGILDISGNVYKMKKISSKANIDLSSLTHSSNGPFSKKTYFDSKSGVLIGLKTPINSRDFSYRTLWISKASTNIKPIYEINEIIFPRKTGFWSLKEDSITNNNLTENIFIPQDLSQKSSSEKSLENLVTEQSIHNYSNGYIEKEITYICNDFISVELKGEATKNGYKKPINKFHIYPVSSLPFEKSVSTTDIFTNQSKDITNKEFSKAFESIKGNNTLILNSLEQEKNIGITRRDSHWLFTGKINYVNDSGFGTKDYNLSIIPPSSIVVYDNLLMPFNNVKEYVPFAKDAFSSPKNDMILVLSDSYIYVYNVIKSNIYTLSIDETPIAKIKLKENEEVIMSEWAVGEHVVSWNEFIKSYKNSKIIKE